MNQNNGIKEQESASSNAKKRSWMKDNAINLLIALLVIVALASLWMTAGATLYNNVEQGKVAKRYAETTQSQEFEKRAQPAKQLKEAEEYNKKVKGPILDPWLARVTKDNVGYQKYLKQLDDPGNKGVMSQIVIPKISVNLPVYHGSTPRVLEKGIGHLYGSHLPVGGEGTRSILTGHTGIKNMTLFDELDKLEKGDVFYINTFGRKMAYKVNDIKVVLPNEVDSLRTVEGKDLVTLITCTPYGINSHRLLVTGERTPFDESDKKTEDVFTGTEPVVWTPWMIGFAVLGIIILLLGLWGIFGRKKNDKDKDENKKK